MQPGLKAQSPLVGNQNTLNFKRCDGGMCDICIYVCMSVCMYVYIHTHMYTYRYTYYIHLKFTCVFINYICIITSYTYADHTDIQTYTYIPTCIHTHTHPLYVYLNLCVFVCPHVLNVFSICRFMCATLKQCTRWPGGVPHDYAVNPPKH